ncbi:MAG: 4-hydroxy-tetrahydrodipicolinate reductase [Clostridiales bacterium]|nr:4-hydroxy-tetrahydrodipicolinate reductase [Clostridiales bacterium]
MGRAVLDAAGRAPDILVVGGVDRAECPGLGVPVFTSLAGVDADADVLIDFSRPEALPGILSFAAARGMAAVLATTGYTDADLKRIERAALRIPVFRSANMSLGVNLLMDLAVKGAQFLGDGCDVEIVESHHRGKADAPSGTALMVADAVRKVYGGEREYVFGRQGRSAKRAPGEIGIHAIRGGTLVGEHAVMFLMDDEVVEVRHTAQSRAIYAAGALRAAAFVVGKPAKLYDMHDLLLSKAPVTHLVASRGAAMIAVAGLPAGPRSTADAMACIAEKGLNLDMIGQSEGPGGAIGISFSLADGDKLAAATAVRARFPQADVRIAGPLVKLTIEGLGMERQAGVAARVFALAGDLGIRPHMVTTAATEISMLIDQCDEFALTDALARAFGI